MKSAQEFETYMSLNHDCISIPHARNVGIHKLDLVFIKHKNYAGHQTRFMGRANAELGLVSTNIQDHV